MKRIQEKVKDIVEVRAFERLADFSSDQAKTLANYHFTDATSDLMAKWLDLIASVDVQNGAANALAGYRGVGKSHFIATMGALVANPELRSRISDAHVANSAQRLLRRHYPVAYIRRGSHTTLVDEFKEAVAKAFEVSIDIVPDSLVDVLTFATQNSGELPFVLLIDTAFERSSRVARDDGAELSEIAEAAKAMNVFVGVALDDDISGADGSNSSISRTFSIDYLDQEHLYKVVNAHVFPKNSQMLATLHEIYTYFRENVPAFRWSEQRFSSLYPLHPAILEVSPFVRLYVHEFALLGFAAEAGEKILGRPANSLIALDEVFDTTEDSLREIDDLKPAFEAYDKINLEIVAQIPVMQRLQAKLILKALMLLSLGGQGATAAEICASMLIYDENDSDAVLANVESLTKTFADTLPDYIRVETEDGRDNRYCFKLKDKDDLTKTLNDAAATVSADFVSQAIRKMLIDRYGDCTFSHDGAEQRKDIMESQIEWRGGLRRGRFIWNDRYSGRDDSPSTTDAKDWEAIIDFDGDEANLPDKSSATSRVIWKIDNLRKSEIDSFLRLKLLSENHEIRAKYGEQIRAAIHSHTILAEQIFNRITLGDSRLIIDGLDYNFTENASSTNSLSELFSVMLEPLFETSYAQHPYFVERLGMGEVASIISDFYNSSRRNLAEIQHLAKTFCLPLGLVKIENGVYHPETEEALRNLPIVAEIFKAIESSGKETVLLKDIYEQYRRPPLGFVRETVHLILAALVDQRQIEFVTSKGDRITSRSLDLKIIWDDVVGIAKPFAADYSLEKLNLWAKRFVTDEIFTSLNNQADRDLLDAKFAEWLQEWHSSAIIERFDRLADNILNTRMWRFASRVNSKFGAVAECIVLAVEKTITLEEALDRISDTFNSSEEEMASAYHDLELLDNFVKGASTREMINAYLSVCEFTNDDEIEQLREKLMRISDLSYSEPTEANNREMEYLWKKFQKQFSEHYSQLHEQVMRSHDIQERWNEILTSDKWWEFDNLSGVSLFDPHFRSETKNLVRQFRQMDCSFDTKHALQTKPFCMCPFSLSKVDSWEHMPEQLWDLVSRALASFRSTLSENAEFVVKRLKGIPSDVDSDVLNAVEHLMQKLNAGDQMSQFSFVEINILRQLFDDGEQTVKKKRTTIGQSAVEADQHDAFGAESESDAINSYRK